jgi:DNA modification methylase
MSNARILIGHNLETLRPLPDGSVHLVVTSPPYYGLRAYNTPPQVWGGKPDCPHRWGAALPGKRARWGNTDTLSAKQASNGGSKQLVEALERDAGNFCTRRGCGAWRGELGQEPTYPLYIEHLCMVMDEVWRVLRNDGSLWLNLGDSSYTKPNGKPGRQSRDRMGRKEQRNQPANGQANRLPQPGMKHKDAMLIPHRVAIALQERGWYVRMDNVWAKGVSCIKEYAGSSMPESPADRTTRTHEYVFSSARARSTSSTSRRSRRKASARKARRAERPAPSEPRNRV